MNKPDPLLDAALTYAKAGLRVFPLGKAAKEPAISRKQGGRGHLDATTDEFVIRRWWLDYSRANIGYSPDDGLLIIDVDVRNGKQGAEQLAALEAKHGALPPTRWVLSGSGGQQCYFRVPPGFKYAARLAEHIDLKGNRGYVLLPPSIHPETKRAYVWGGDAGFKADIAELPAAWLEICQRREPEPAAADDAPADQQREYAPAQLPPILDGCAWLRHCQADAKTLSEPDWYAMLSVVACCADGRKHAHELSRPHSGYSAPETGAKFEHAKTAAGPVTCARVSAELGGQALYCGSCQHWGKITSPVQLGQQQAAEPWRKSLQLTKSTRPFPNLYNATIALAEHPDLQGRLGFDEFREKIIIGAGMPFGIEAGDLDEGRFLGLARWLQRHLTPTLAEGTARSAIEYVARRAPQHPLRDWLLGLVWDGIPRVRENFFQRYFGARAVALHTASDDQALYWDDAALVFMVSLVARVLRPAAQVDYLLVLEGVRGGHKAKALEILAGPRYYTSQLPPRLDWQAATEQIRGMWLVHLADLGQLLQAESARQFIARRVDQYRPSFGKLGKVSVERQCVFAATTSEQRYLWDDAGTRYILPIHTSEIALRELHADRPQLFAEAVALFKSGCPWRPAQHLASIYRREQAARLITDPWESKVLTYARHNAGFTVAQALDKLDVPFHLQTRQMEIRIERMMLRHGFRAQESDAGETEWYNPNAEPGQRPVVQ
jgi:predicted P-loop ATPase